jgi:hypothetical protein
MAYLAMNPPRSAFPTQINGPWRLDFCPLPYPDLVPAVRLDGAGYAVGMGCSR